MKLETHDQQKIKSCINITDRTSIWNQNSWKKDWDIKRKICTKIILYHLQTKLKAIPHYLIYIAPTFYFFFPISSINLHTKQTNPPSMLPSEFSSLRTYLRLRLLSLTMARSRDTPCVHISYSLWLLHSNSITRCSGVFSPKYRRSSPPSSKCRPGHAITSLHTSETTPAHNIRFRTQLISEL